MSWITYTGSSIHNHLEVCDKSNIRLHTIRLTLKDN